MRGGLLTNLEHTRRHMSEDAGCKIYKNGQKDLIHVLWDSRSSNDFWRRVVSISEYPNFFSLPFEEWLLQNSSFTGPFSSIKPDWCIHFVIFCWNLWNRRNLILFDSEYVERMDFLDMCNSYVEQIVVANTGNRILDCGSH
ncbi:hypothetical protein V6N13_017188 [Hibiscus sabdariffa]